LIAIHDDLNIVGPQQDAFNAFDLFQQRLVERGDLQLQPSKCRVLIPETQLQHNAIQNHIHAQATQRNLQMVYGSMEILGGCVGIDNTIKLEHVTRKTESHKPLLHAIQHSSMPSQSAYLILKSCINTRIGYLARVTRPEICSVPFQAFDISVLDTIQNKMLLPPHSSYSDFTKELIRLPVDLGGYGIPSAIETSPVAYFSSIVSSLPFLPLPLAPHGPTLASLKRCHSSLLTSNTGVESSDRIPHDFLTMLSTYSSIDSASKSRHIQHHITEQVDKFAYLNLMSRHTTTQVQRAALASASAPSAGLAFTILPSQAEFTFASPYFNQMTRLRLGLPHHDVHTSDNHDLIQGQLSIDEQGMNLRHNMITNAVVQIAQDAGYETVREQNMIDDQGVVTRADAALYSQYANRPPIMVDISVINPCATSYVKKASKKSLAAATLRENSKEKRYTQVIKHNSSVFYPLIVETHGGFGRKLTAFLKMLVTDATDHHHLSETEARSWLHNAKCTIAVALQVGNAMMSCRSLRTASINRKRVGTDHISSQQRNSIDHLDLVEEQSYQLASAA
jgi:hypothetical protein